MCFTLNQVKVESATLLLPEVVYKFSRIDVQMRCVDFLLIDLRSAAL